MGYGEEVIGAEQQVFLDPITYNPSPITDYFITSRNDKWR
jgi:hypothetical protein